MFASSCWCLSPDNLLALRVPLRLLSKPTHACSQLSSLQPRSGGGSPSPLGRARRSRSQPALPAGGPLRLPHWVEFSSLTFPEVPSHLNFSIELGPEPLQLIYIDSIRP